MLRRFNLVRTGLLAFGALVAFALAAPHQADAAAMSPAKLDRSISGAIASPVHCKPYFHCIKRCRRCVRICHRCPKGN
ncbi:hypothetical protein [Methyloceanibacter sp. wino2]|uniref:hypothetical protein n=1 Tax=Methyloceanibacter sp. wino2 TaxID=2170729 RepID=UPI00131F2223|nr:hypothetical protein [Methyloceanibacter sp. wino2]